MANEFKRDEAGAGKLANESWRAVLNRDATYFNSKRDISEMIFFFLIHFQKDHFVSDVKTLASEFIYYQMQCHGNCLSVCWKASLLFTAINHPNKKQIAAAGVVKKRIGGVMALSKSNIILLLFCLSLLIYI